ncbi:adhesion G-protein coupled receptor G4 isoform X2 [Hippocampus comes]|uniref:adhesion G-protein coupled receptor G4 isoform X2 n=1 Tax=Hippocampus comes TaxID=109280 RepID=UPI00094E00B6|nr:PREDICTED: adhesion G-protein coupled receptor G4-like isoform X2 [Hippocampus comes]
MNSVASLSSLTACLFLSMCLLSSPSSSSSLWGQKIHFGFRPCVWQLHPDTVVPPLRNLSVCMLLQRAYDTEWIAFVYKAPGSRHVELGLGGTGTQLVVWVFGQEWRLDLELNVLQWYSVCLTWSGGPNRLQVFLNGTMRSEASFANVIADQHLGHNGTLTLGMSHYVDASGAVKVEKGNNLIGAIGQFRMWSSDWNEEELGRRMCADGDVVSWDLRHWKHDCPLEKDASLHCAWSFFKVKMQTSLRRKRQPGNCSESLTNLTREWFETIFPQHISISDISVDSPVSPKCGVQILQQSRAVSATACNKCFSSEVTIKVDPADSVEVVQAYVAKRLVWTFSTDTLILTAEHNSIRVLPVESSSPVMTSAPPTVTLPGTTQRVPEQVANMSTTGNPLYVNVSADVFLRAKLKLDFIGNASKPEKIIEHWLKKKLEAKGTSLIWNVLIVEVAWRNAKRLNIQTRFHEQFKQYTCDFHVQDYSMKHIEEIKYFINTTLTPQYANDSSVIQTTDMTLKQIFPPVCLEEVSVTIYGKYFWPETCPQVNQTMRCSKPSSKEAFRLCELHLENDTTSWAQPDMTNCSPIESISELENITVTTDNAAEVVDLIQNLVNSMLGNATQLPPSELHTVVEKLNQVVNVTTVTQELGDNIVRVFSDILISDTDVAPVAASILNLTDKMGNTMEFENESLSLTAPSLALSMIDVAPEGFNGLTFRAVSMSSFQEPNVLVNQSFEGKPIPAANATISLPSTLHNFLPPGQRNKTRVQFQFYGTQDLFQGPQTANATTRSDLMLNSYIVSASINGSHVSNLSDGERVVITLRHRKAKQNGDRMRCVFWDFQENGGLGGWSSLGCETWTLSPYQTRCLCEHLTHFAVLLDVSRTPISESHSHILNVLSYIGCGISALFLGITLLTYLAFEKLRRDYPSKILINLSAALLGLSLIFLLDSWLSSFYDYSLCIVTAATLHYFLLASFTWMALEAVHMHFALVKVFNTYVPAYILKFCAVGWGVPLAIVCLVLAIDKDAYGNTKETAVAAKSKITNEFCWLQNDIFFYVTVAAFVLLVLLCNATIFVVVLIQIRKTAANKKASTSSRSTMQDLRAVASLTVLLGLTWLVGFLTFGKGKVAMMYLFTIFNTLQGFFVFLFHCLMKENVRKQWRIHLCCGALRLADRSDWSATTGGHRRKENLINSSSTVKTSLRNTSESDTGMENQKGA